MKYFNRQEAEKHAEMRYPNLDAYGKILAKRTGFVYGAEWMADKITHEERASPDSYREALEKILEVATGDVWEPVVTIEEITRAALGEKEVGND